MVIISALKNQGQPLYCTIVYPTSSVSLLFLSLTVCLCKYWVWVPRVSSHIWPGRHQNPTHTWDLKSRQRFYISSWKYSCSGHIERRGCLIVKLTNNYGTRPEVLWVKPSTSQPRQPLGGTSGKNRRFFHVGNILTKLHGNPYKYCWVFQTGFKCGDWRSDGATLSPTPSLALMLHRLQPTHRTQQCSISGEKENSIYP